MAGKLSRLMRVAAFAGLLCSGTAMAQSCFFSPGFGFSPPGCNVSSSSSHEPDPRDASAQFTNRQAINLGSLISSAVSYGFSSLGNGRRTGLDLGGNGRAAAGFDGKLNAWAALGQTETALDYAPANSSGRTTLGLLGVDYMVASNVLLGVAASWDENRVTFNPVGGNGRADGNGYTVSPYLAWQIDRNWLMDASLGFGRASVDIRNGTLTGSTADRRNSVSASLSYLRSFGSLDFTGKATLANAQNTLGAFVSTDATRTAIAELSTRTTQLRIGGQLAYSLGVAVPYAGLYYLNDFDRPIIPGAANDRDAFQFVLGVNFFSKGALSGGVMYSTETNRSQVKNDQLLANIAVRF